MARSPTSLCIAILPAAALYLLGPALPGADCNDNGIEDQVEVAPGKPAFSVEARIETVAPPVDLVAADLTGSGALDVLAVFWGFLSLFRNEGDLRFREERIAPAQPIRFRALMDPDRDGDLDLVGLGTTSPGLLFLENRGDGSFAESGSFPLDMRLEAPLLVRDFDDDGRPDLALGVTYPFLPPQLPPRVLLLRQRDGFDFVKLGEVSLDLSSWSIESLEAVDLDSDADLDLLAGTPVGVQSLWSDGRGALTPGPLSVSCPHATRLESSDFDLDGDPELVSLSYPGLAFFQFEAPGLFGSRRDFLVGTSPAGLVTADLDQDGDPDLVTAAYTDQSSVVVLENGGGSLRVARRVRVDDCCVGGALASADFDRDGYLDLIVAGDGITRDWITILRNRPAPLSLDCNANAVPDDCEVGAPGACADCNRNALPDRRDLDLGVSLDQDGSGVPDDCEVLGPFTMGFQAPPVVRARAGSIVRFPAGVLLHQTAPDLLVSSWAVVVGADGATITQATTRGTVAAPWPEGLRKQGYSRTGRFRSPPEACGAQALSVIVLSTQDPNVNLDPSGTPHELLRLTLEAGVPRSEAVALRLWFLVVCNGGQQIESDDRGPGAGATGLGMGVTAGGQSYDPHKLEANVLLVPVPLNFRRGDANSDGAVDISDPIALLTHLFLGAAAPPCDSAADATDDGALDISDPVRILDDFFLQGASIPPPGPYRCGEDPTADALECIEYAPCPPP